MVGLTDIMLLDTESSVGKECEEQGWWLHGGHTTKGAVDILQFWTESLSWLLYKSIFGFKWKYWFYTHNLYLFSFFLISIAETLWKSLHKAWFIQTTLFSVAAKTACVLWNVTLCSLLPGVLRNYLAQFILRLTDHFPLSRGWCRSKINHSKWLSKVSMSYMIWRRLQCAGEMTLREQIDWFLLVSYKQLNL